MLEICADERAVHRFYDDRFARRGTDDLLKVIARLPRPVGGVREARIVADMVNGTTTLAPMRQQTRRVFLGTRVVSHAPTRIVDRILQINQDERRIRRETQPLHSRISSW